MEIIDELEDKAARHLRGLRRLFLAPWQHGYLHRARTSVVKNGVMYVQAGAGVVANSVPEREQAECVEQGRAPCSRPAEEAGGASPHALSAGNKAGEETSVLTLSLLYSVSAKSSWEQATRFPDARDRARFEHPAGSD